MVLIFDKLIFILSVLLIGNTTITTSSFGTEHQNELEVWVNQVEKNGNIPGLKFSLPQKVMIAKVEKTASLIFPEISPEQWGHYHYTHLVSGIKLRLTESINSFSSSSEQPNVSLNRLAELLNVDLVVLIDTKAGTWSMAASSAEKLQILLSNDRSDSSIKTPDIEISARDISLWIGKNMGYNGYVLDTKNDGSILVVGAPDFMEHSTQGLVMMRGSNSLGSFPLPGNTKDIIGKIFSSGSYGIFRSIFDGSSSSNPIKAGDLVLIQ